MKAASIVLGVFACACAGDIHPGGAAGPGRTDEPPRMRSGGASPAAGSAADPLPRTCDPSAPMLGRIPLRRLSRVEYLNTVEDLLFGLPPAMTELPRDSVEGGFENSSRLLSAPPLLVERYELTAARAAEAAIADPKTRVRILPCTRWDTRAEQDRHGDGKQHDPHRQRPLGHGCHDRRNRLVLELLAERVVQQRVLAVEPREFRLLAHPALETLEIVP